MPVRINVTQRDIDAARAWAAQHGGNLHDEHCPVAQAVCRSYGISPKQGVVYVDYTGIGIRTPDDVLIPITNNVRDFAYAFDREETVAPFSFELDVDRLPDVVAVR